MFQNIRVSDVKSISQLVFIYKEYEEEVFYFLDVILVNICQRDY